MSKSEHPIGAKEEVSGKVQKASTYKCLKIEYEWCETKGLGKLSKAMRQGMVACSVASAHRSLGHAQPLQHDRAARRDVDNASRILAIEDGLPGILRSDGDVLADY